MIIRPQYFEAIIVERNGNQLKIKYRGYSGTITIS